MRSIAKPCPYSNVSTTRAEEKWRTAIGTRQQPSCPALAEQLDKLLVTDLEPGKTLRGIEVLRQTVGDVAGKRCGNLRDKGLRRGRIGVDGQLHAPVVQVLYITGNGKTPCDGRRRVTKTDPLHSSPVDQTPPNAFLIVRICQETISLSSTRNLISTNDRFLCAERRFSG